MTPTKSQLDAINEFEQWLSTDEKYFTLRAGAGRGKSWTTLNGFIPALINKGKSFDIVATTKQACDSLVSLLGSGSSLNPMTLHSFLGCIPTTKDIVWGNPKQFRKSKYFLKNQIVVENSNILLVDEAFRVEQELLDIIDYLMPNKRIVWIGDPFQTPPIGFSKSPVEDLKSRTVTLYESPRFKRFSPLADLVNNLLMAVQFEEKNYLDLLPSENTEGINLVPKKHLQIELNKRLVSGNAIDYREMCILSATRKKTDDYNNYCVKVRAKVGLPIIHQSENIVIDTAIAEDRNPTLYWLRTNNKLPVLKATKQLHDDAVNFIKSRAVGHTSTLLKVATPLCVEGNCIIYLLTGDGGKGLSGSQMKNLWAIRRELGINFIFIRLSIAKTIHLAQGITSPDVYIDMESVARWHDDDMKRRLYYTGISRCSSNLYLMR